MILYIVNAGLGCDSVLLAHSGKGVCVGIVTGYGPGGDGVVSSYTVVGGGAECGVFLVTESDTRNHCGCHQWKKLLLSFNNWWGYIVPQHVKGQDIMISSSQVGFFVIYFDRK